METARCRAFLAAAETGSFSRAAEMLRYTPSGVNQLVTALEKEIGFSLFSRSTKGVALTANGQLLLPVIREILHQEDKLFELSAQQRPVKKAKKEEAAEETPAVEEKTSDEVTEAPAEADKTDAE